MNDFASGGRRYLALWFPFMAADRLRLRNRTASRPDADAPDVSSPEAPLAFVEKVRGALRLAAVDRDALSLGITPGLTLADARARVPHLAVADSDPVADQDWLERLADGCDRYTPMVALDAPDGLMLDITGCAHLFGEEAGLVADVEARLARLGMTMRHALACTPDAAHALARYQQVPAHDEAAAVRRLPVAALRLDPDDEIALKRAGLKTIADLADRPMAPLAARFGENAAVQLRRLLGREDVPIRPCRRAPALYVERRFAEPVARTEYALRVLEDLATEAGKRLETDRLGGRRFEARFFRTDGLVWLLGVETSLPTRDPAVLTRLFRERIDSIGDPIDPGFGFDLIRLDVPATEAMEPTQLRLEGGAVAEAEVAALIDRLSTRLGRNRIRRVYPRGSHIPEQAVLSLPATVPSQPVQWPAVRSDDPPQRPIYLFDPPQPIEVLAEVPDGPPHRFRWRRTQHDVARFEGPERIAHEWWRRESGTNDGGRGLTRDYYRVEDVRGRRFWIFRHGLYGAEKINPGWYLHGLFA